VALIFTGLKNVGRVYEMESLATLLKPISNFMKGFVPFIKIGAIVSM
jgi:hypothetical protein